ncbi:DUF4422 domain-containing protein [Faecalispora sporosphaeroides]|uniref:DUF4422 domain-containing protein n=1 Tax=Faecalispora sporosphaeroides TaxID=1549 RepID=UPI00039AF516|nr:DUF4422 domain-containing protein [Faecalispora sporosphaeroides]
MPDIKIFVSRRIDIESEYINYSIYYPMRCGAIFDNSLSPSCDGDNTGDNISQKRMSFCEFTVQYWAWKNYKAEYYGMCHYRRYLSFVNSHIGTQFNTNQYNMLCVPLLTKRSAEKYVINNNNYVKDLISQYDAVVSKSAIVEKISVPSGNSVGTVSSLWESYDGIYIKKSSLNLLIKLIEEHFPQYLNSAIEYLGGNEHRGFNCFVMKRDLFYKMCQFQFDIMFELEKQLDTVGYTETMRRTPAFVGEILYGVFVYHIQKQNKYKILELPIVFFYKTERVTSFAKALIINIYYYMAFTIRKILNILMPVGSKKRKILKRFISLI